MILRQHYLYNEFDYPVHTSKPIDNVKMLIRYVDQVTRLIDEALLKEDF
jgi:hypothetical protein